jgi:hypothetical protein
MRIEIGGPGSDFILWAGSGLTGVGTGQPDDESQPIFFIDKEGNAVFTGTVDAKFVAGEISRTAIVREDWGETGLQLNKGQRGLDLDEIPEEDWTYIGEYELPEPPFATGHIPWAQISFLMYGKNQFAGAARLEIKYSPTGDWYWLAASVYNLAYGGQRELNGVVTNDERVYGRVWIRLAMVGFDRYAPIVNQVRGLLMGIR